MSYIRNGIGDIDFDRKALKLKEGVPLWTIYDPRRGGPHDPLLYLLSGGLGNYRQGFAGTTTPTTEKKLYFHRETEKLHEAILRVKASSNLFSPEAKNIHDRAVQLRDEIAPYHDEGHAGWDGCSRFSKWMFLSPLAGAAVACPLNPYLSKHEITQRLREVITLASQKMSNAQRALTGKGYITSETREGRIKAISEGMTESEKSRGSDPFKQVVCNLPGVDKVCAAVDTAGEMEVANNSWYNSSYRLSCDDSCSSIFAPLRYNGR